MLEVVRASGGAGARGTARSDLMILMWWRGAQFNGEPGPTAKGLMTSSRDLADRFHRRWLEHNPFTATMYGIPGYDDLVPDESEEGDQAWRAEAGEFLLAAGAIDREQLTPEDAVTLDCTTEAATQELASIDMARPEYMVTAMQYAGPADRTGRAGAPARLRGR